jgi:hypothetical protein
MKEVDRFGADRDSQSLRIVEVINAVPGCAAEFQGDDVVFFAENVFAEERRVKTLEYLSEEYAREKALELFESEFESREHLDWDCDRDGDGDIVPYSLAEISITIACEVGLIEYQNGPAKVEGWLRNTAWTRPAPAQIAWRLFGEGGAPSGFDASA